MSALIAILLATTAATPGGITYSNVVADILHRRCVECHHKGGLGPFPLTDYSQASGWSAMIAEVAEQRRMPPWNATHGEFSNANLLTPSERKALILWSENGAPAGDRSYEPETPELVSGWALSREPDAVFNVTEQPVRIPATDIVDYQYTTVDPGFTEDKWVSEIQIVPGNRRVVHHCSVTVRTPKTWAGNADNMSAALGTYVPGAGVYQFPKGAAMLIPAGSTLECTLHYQPIGTLQTDQSQIGLVFAEPETVERAVVYRWTSDGAICIPPHEPNYVSVDSFDWPGGDAELLSIWPHMHLRGRAVKVFADYPDGESECLLEVPRYDFNWQFIYELDGARRFPPGTKLRTVMRFDNSDGNPYNPDPSKTVRWGKQTTDEMMITLFAMTQSR